MTLYRKVKEYYPKYLSVHQNKTSRLLHFIGQGVTIGWIVGSIYFQLYWLLLLAPFIIYPYAWSGHLFFEMNKPATWSVNPLLTKACDWVMFFDILRGRIKI